LWHLAAALGLEVVIETLAVAEIERAAQAPPPAAAVGASATAESPAGSSHATLTSSGWSLLHCAVAMRQWGLVRKLLACAPAAAASAAATAADVDAAEIAGLFAQLGQRALAGHVDSSGRTPLHDAVAVGAPLDVVSALLDAAPYPAAPTQVRDAFPGPASRLAWVQKSSPLALALLRPTLLPVLELLLARAPPGSAWELSGDVPFLLSSALRTDFGDQVVLVVEAMVRATPPELVRQVLSRPGTALSALCDAATKESHAPALVEVSRTGRRGARC
jgi:hypothetical protein